MPRKSPPSSLSLDQAIKELLQLCPVDTLSFLLPEVPATRGDPVSWQFHNVQVRKKDLARKGLVMDLNIEFSFEEGPPLLLVLVEHWSTARSVDLLRTAQYFLDLSSRFPEHQIVPVALVTEPDTAPIVDSFSRSALGQEFLRFSTRVVQLSTVDAAQWTRARNLVAATMLMVMGGALARQEKLFATIRFFQQHPNEDETRLLFPLLSQLGRLNPEEHAMTIKYLTQLPKPLFMVMMEEQANSEGLAKGMEKGMALGHREKALEDARKMREHGISWDIITDVTGIHPQELDSAQA
ncbi:MAG: hypothetical protein IPO40_10250 [Fibrobacteres bacterium]|nr:hypothetical protein [Fibrobacterota bacterium]